VIAEHLPERLLAALLALILAACAGAASPGAGSPSNIPTHGSGASPTGLLPEGSWQVQLSSSELSAAGAPESMLAEGLYTWTFDEKRARISAPSTWGTPIVCEAEASRDGSAVILTYPQDSGCGAGTDRIQWTLDAAGLHFKLLETTGDFDGNRAYLEAKPWQPVEPESPNQPALGAGTALKVGCSESSPCRLSAGTWTLTGQFSFILGMKLTVPDGWQSQEQDAGEFNIWPLDHPRDHLFMVRDIAAVRSDGSMEQVAGVAQTEDGLIGFWRRDPNLVVSQPMPTTIANGIDATTYVISVSRKAQFKDPGCPAYPRCADFFTDPAHWDGGVYGIGAPAEVRLYFATIGSGVDEHLLVIGLEGANARALERLTHDTRPIIDSIRMPSTITVW
jgi:hypothetical protein